jgi:hypothetical protein
MVNNIKKKPKKKTGRPPVDSFAVTVRISAVFAKEIEIWCRLEPDKPGLPEALRRLAQIGLKAKK